MRTNYPLNCWYVAALSDEVGEGLLARRLLDKHVVLYRRASGEVVALEDRCVHRAFPLSEGRLDGDRVVCGYHGFSYEPDGCLADVPSQENVPPGARVPAYPVVETAPFVWIGSANRVPRPCAHRHACRGTSTVPAGPVPPRFCASKRITFCCMSTTSI